MLRLPAFKYIRPSNLTETFNQLSIYQNEGIYIAGGTDLLPNIKRGVVKPEALISLKQLPELQFFLVKEEGIMIGAGMTIAQLVNNTTLQTIYPALSKAASLIATPQIRNVGTVGGNLCLDTRCNYYNQSEFWRKSLGYCMKKEGTICWVATKSKKCLAIQSSDLAPILIALDAKIHLQSADEQRWLYLEDFYKDDGIHFLNKGQNEILTKVFIPFPKQKVNERIKTTFHKLRRRGSFDFSVLSVATTVKQDKEGICTSVRIIIGAIAAAPIRVKIAETHLLGKKITEKRIKEAADLAYTSIFPFDNADMTVAYRKQMIQVFVSKSLHESALT